MEIESKAILPEKWPLLSHESKKKLMRQAKEICSYWKVDLLSADSWRRKSIDTMDFEEVLDKFRDNDISHFTVMRRNESGENHIEICWNTMADKPDYFIWIHLSPVWLDMIKEFILEEAKNGK